MAKSMGTSGELEDLFGALPARLGALPARRRNSRSKREAAPALTTARVLCRQLRRNKARPDKKRIAHLICLNLVSVLRQDPQRA
jgi:hypothetical protein